MSRGRPRGSVKADRRQRRDYRFSPTTMQLIEQGQQRTDMRETAFVEAAIQHYAEFLAGEETEAQEVEQLPDRIQHLERELEAARLPRVQSALGDRQRSVSPAVVAASASPSSSRRLPYQIYVKHASGQCPRLPEEFAYIDLDESIEPRQCPIHRVFAQPCAMSFLRHRVEQLKAVPGIVSIWPDKGGQTLSKDCWRWERGRWIRDD